MTRRRIVTVPPIVRRIVTVPPIARAVRSRLTRAQKAAPMPKKGPAKAATGRRIPTAADVAETPGMAYAVAQGQALARAKAVRAFKASHGRPPTGRDLDQGKTPPFQGPHRPQTEGAAAVQAEVDDRYRRLVAAKHANGGPLTARRIREVAHG